MASYTAANLAQLVTAIMTANGNSTPDMIQLTGSTPYFLTAANHTDEKGANGLPKITSEITIIGDGATIARNSTEKFRFFHITSDGDLTLNGVTLEGGESEFDGGAILSEGSITIIDGVVSENTAVSFKNGGGIYCAAGSTLLLHNTLVSDNHAFKGGGIYNSGKIRLTDSTISGNTALKCGGGLFNAVGAGDSWNGIVQWGNNHSFGEVSGPVDWWIDGPTLHCRWSYPAGNYNLARINWELVCPQPVNELTIRIAGDVPHGGEWQEEPCGSEWGAHLHISKTNANSYVVYNNTVNSDGTLDHQELWQTSGQPTSFGGGWGNEYRVCPYWENPGGVHEWTYTIVSINGESVEC